MKSKIKRYLLALIVVTAVVIISFGWWLFARHNSYPASIIVEHGEPFYKIVVKLKDREVIGSPWLFSKIGILAGLDRQVIPGRYDFDRKVSNFDVLRKLWQGDIAVMSFTVPEGYNLKQIRQLLHQRCGTDPDAFDSLVRDSHYLAWLGIEAGFAEGYLFPETYNFQWGITATEAVETMIGELFLRLNDSMMARCNSLGYTLHELLTMASIIELEGTAADEFGKIASVYSNRDKIGMKLQADPTVIYGMGGLDRELRVKDYQFPSRYNTYLYKGLPPTPICSPGLRAIMAAMYPDSTDYYYFVADGNGRHIFNKNYKQHLKDTQRIKKELKRQRR
jgi:UPF0755 protein